MMRKIGVLLSLLLVSQIAFASVEFLGVDGVPTSYVASTGVLSMSGSDLVITIDYNDGSPQSSIDSGTFSLNTTRDSGFHFEGGSFQFTDGSTVLLEGDVISIDFEEVFSFLAGSGVAEVLGENLDGNLLGYSEIVTITFSIDPGFEGFDTDFSGLSKVNFLVPEPATFGILAVGAIFLRRKRS